MGSAASTNKNSESPIDTRSTPIPQISDESSSILQNNDYRLYVPNNNVREMSDMNAISSRSSSSESSESVNVDSDLTYSALSLGMDSDDLLFNLYFFGATRGGNVLNTVLEETYAAHSVANTPYKLHPASDAVLTSLDVRVLDDSVTLDYRECSVCKEELNAGVEVVFLPLCRHCFHHECAVRWLSLQAWCPVCRAGIVKKAAESTDNPIVSLSTTEEGYPLEIGEQWESIDGNSRIVREEAAFVMGTSTSCKSSERMTYPDTESKDADDITGDGKMHGDSVFT